jgi:hypothetical protein
MDKGIRQECNRKFLELLPTRENTRIGNAKFRASVIGHVMEAFGATLAAAATHYNHAFIQAKAMLVDPKVDDETKAKLTTQLEGLGRPEDKKGGRKKKVVEAAALELSDEEKAAALEIAQQQTIFSVKEKNGGALIAEGLSLEEAKAMCEAQNKRVGKKKLYWV